MMYQELKGNITPFLKLYRSVKAAGMSEQHILNLFKIANDNLPALEQRYERLKKEVNSLECRKLNSKTTLQALTKTLDSCSLHYKEQIEKVAELQSRKIALENLVKRFENNNEEYLKIKQTVKQEVSSILSNDKVLLRLALFSLIQSIRNQPVKYSSLIYYNGIYGLQQQQQQYSSQNYYIEHYTAMLVQEVEKLYNKLVTDLSNRVIYDAAFSSSTLSSSSPVLSSSDGKMYT